MKDSDSTGFEAMPTRYATPQGEAIDIIRRELGDEGCIAFCRGNALKYELRTGKKAGASAENDIEKACWYRQFADFVRGIGPDPRAGRK